MIRFLASTKLAVTLCLVLAAVGVGGSLLYRGNTAPGGATGFNIFRSPLFLVPAALLLVNILACAGSRIAGLPLRRARTWTFAGIHLGLVLLAAGMAVDGLLGSVGTRYFQVGVPSSSYFDWRSNREETFPFTVEVVDYRVQFHPMNIQVGIKDAEGKKLGLYTVREGTSFRVRDAGVVVTPRRFEPETKTLVYDLAAGGRTSSGLVAGPGEAPPVAGVSVVPVSWHDPEPSEFVATARFALPGRPPEEKIIRVNAPAEFGGISFCLVGDSRDRYLNTIVGLQMTRQPGAPVFWAGAALFIMSLLGHFLARRASRSVPEGAAAPELPLPAEGSGSDFRAGVLIVALLAGGGLVFAPAIPAGAGEAGRAIAGEETWEGEVRVVAPVTVEKGATLRVRPGTRVLLSGEDGDGDGCRDGYIQVFGTLIVEGEMGRPVRFLPLTPGKPWQEIFLKDAEGVVRHAEFSGGLWGLHIHDGDVKVEHAVFRDNGGGTRLKGTGASFSRCTFRDNGVAIRFWEGGPRVSDSVIEGNGVGLFYREGTGGGRFRGNRIGNREWNLKIGEWAAGDLDASGNWWSAEFSGSRNPAEAGWSAGTSGSRNPAEAGWSAEFSGSRNPAEAGWSAGTSGSRNPAEAGWSAGSSGSRNPAEAKPEGVRPSESREGGVPGMQDGTPRRRGGTGWSAAQAALVQDYREKKEGGRIVLQPALPEPPSVCGADDGPEEQR